MGAISFVVSTLIGMLSSPFLVDWYTGAKVLAEIHTYRGQDTGACGDWRMVIENIGRTTAKNVRIHFDVDSFTARGTFSATTAVMSRSLNLGGGG